MCMTAAVAHVADLTREGGPVGEARMSRDIMPYKGECKEMLGGEWKCRSHRYGWAAVSDIFNVVKGNDNTDNK